MDDCCKAWAGTPAPRQALVLRVAVELLHAASGRQFGVCPVQVRPCRDNCDSPCGRSSGGPGWWGSSGWLPILDDGRMFNCRACAPCGPGGPGGGCSGCSCARLCEVTLPGPVASIAEVRLDGVVVPADRYVVHDARRLVALAGPGAALCWPTCQRLDLPDTATGTFSVAYWRGVPVPAAGLWAAGFLACELLKACPGAGGGGDCVLPANVQRLVREGVTIELSPADLARELGRGRGFGLPLVDQWVTLVNPYGAKQPSRVYSPDRPRPVRQSWPCTPPVPPSAGPVVADG